MNFIRMGEVNLSDMALLPSHEKMDGSFLAFELLDYGVLENACLYGKVMKASLMVFVTYQVEINCVVGDGHKAVLKGQCAPEEFKMLKNLCVEGHNV